MVKSANAYTSLVRSGTPSMLLGSIKRSISSHRRRTLHRMGIIA